MRTSTPGIGNTWACRGADGSWAETPMDDIANNIAVEITDFQALIGHLPKTCLHTFHDFAVCVAIAEFFQE
jgi:hypothetical protein